MFKQVCLYLTKGMKNIAENVGEVERAGLR